MNPKASIVDVSMDAWPPVTVLARLDPPWEGRTHVAIMSNGVEYGATATYVCPCTPDGLPKGALMTALLRLDLCSPADALAAIGYELSA